MTLHDLTTSVLTRLGDTAQRVWSVAEATLHVQTGYRQIATTLRVFFDWVYLENLPRGFSYTQSWEQALLPLTPHGFDYGCANYTCGDERALWGADAERHGPAAYTSPFEATDGWLSSAGASTAIPATADVPKTLTRLDRVTWDERGIDALTPRQAQQGDARYEITTGEVYAFLWQKDGIRTLRKVRVPSAQADTVTVNGWWGLLRRPTDLSADTVRGTWGLPRRIPGLHPIGPDPRGQASAAVFGAPRRVYLDGKNVRVEHFRYGSSLVNASDVCELPDRYALYLRDYAQWQLLARAGPGQDVKLAAHFQQRWTRGLARIARRLERVDAERVSVLGGGGRGLTTRPPRPKLPWQYGAVVR